MGVVVSIPYNEIRDSVRGLDDYVHRIYEGRRYQIAEEFIDLCTPFVPVKTGNLRLGASIVDNGYAVEWSAINPKNGFDYAPRQYYEYFYHPIDGSDHWDEEMLLYEGDTFYERVKGILER